MRKSPTILVAASALAAGLAIAPTHAQGLQGLIGSMVSRGGMMGEGMMGGGMMGGDMMGGMGGGMGQMAEQCSQMMQEMRNGGRAPNDQWRDRAPPAPPEPPAPSKQ